MRAALGQENRFLLNGVSITPREKDVIACLTSGNTNKKIALLLGITPLTVETHVKNILFKLEACSRGDVTNLVENSEYYLEIKRHYSKILAQTTGKNILLDENILIHDSKEMTFPIRGFSDSKKTNFFFIITQQDSFFCLF